MNCARHALADMQAEFPPVAAAHVQRAAVNLDTFALLTPDDLNLGAFDPIRSVIEHPDGYDRSADAARCARDMVRAGFSDDQIVGVLMNPDNAVSGHVLEQKDDLRAATRALAFARAQAEGDAERGGAGSRAGNRGEGAPAPQATADTVPLALIDVGSLAGKPVQDQPWVIAKLVPDRQVTLYTARGGAGKSHTALTFCASVSLGVPAFGFATTQGVAIYITCEDDNDENHRRMIGVANGLNVGLDRFAGIFFAKSLVEYRDKGIARLDQNTNRLHVESLFHELRATLLLLKPKLVALDNVAHFFEGNENIRAHVAAFIGLLNSLALECDCAIILIGHPNKAGDSFSGSTAFQNQVRSHLHLEVDEDDPDLRLLTLAKANYARLEEPVRVRWNRGAFRLEADVPEDDASRFNALNHRQNELFFTCLDKLTAQQMTASHSKNAGNYAPKVFATMPDAKGMKVADFERTMARLFAGGRIERGEYDFNRAGTSGHKAEGIRRVAQQEAQDEPF